MGQIYSEELSSKESFSDPDFRPDETSSMAVVEALYAGDAEAVDVLELDFLRRTKSRLRARTVCGQAVGLFLPRGTVLRDGQKLLARDGRVLAVRAAPEDLMELRCTDAYALARAAYHLGNRHVAVQIGQEDAEAHSEGGAVGWLRLQADHVLEGMLRGLGGEIRTLRAPFEPESGAYAHGHQNPGDGSGAKIHPMLPLTGPAAMAGSGRAFSSAI